MCIMVGVAELIRPLPEMLSIEASVPVNLSLVDAWERLYLLINIL